MIVLGAGTYDVAFVVVVILIAKVPIQPPIDLDREPRFRRLKAHRIRGDEYARGSCRIGDAIALSIVFIDSICGIETHSWSKKSSRVDKEEVVSYEVETATFGVLNIIEEEIDDCVAVKPVVVVTGVD